jgi:hypothetical protein
MLYQLSYAGPSTVVTDNTQMHADYSSEELHILQLRSRDSDFTIASRAKVSAV